MKHLALVLVILGAGIAAAQGARNTDEMMARQEAEGRAQLLAKARDGAFDAYCKARVDAQLPIADGCKDPDAVPPAPAPAEEKKEEAPPEGEPAPEPDQPTTAELAAERMGLVKAGEEEVAKLRASGGTLPPAVAELRTAWLDAKAAAVVPEATVATQGPMSVGPVGRLDQWFSLAGLPFIGGLVLVAFGGWLRRYAEKKEMAEVLARGPADASSDDGPVDFGELLGRIHDAVVELHAQLEANATPSDDDHDAMKIRVEEIQLSDIERVVTARKQLEARFGLGGFAAVFSPFSSGERNMNRCWSALVDHHWPEATRSAQLAAAGFRGAADELKQLVDQSASA